jgi:hypothetical protein
VLELAQATRATFAAHVEYQRLRKKELEIIQQMAGDDFEEVEWKGTTVPTLRRQNVNGA